MLRVWDWVIATHLRKPFGLKELHLRIVRAFQLIDAAGGEPALDNEYYLLLINVVLKMETN